MVQSQLVNDNLLWDTHTTEDFANSSGVVAFDYAPPFYPTPDSPPERRLQAASQISDQRLVWGEFWTNRDSE